MSEIDPKSYDRQPGEPNRWYHRFHHFMKLGPERSLPRTYREIINPQRIQAGKPPLPTTASCPNVWRQRAREYNWDERAESYDRQQRRLALQKIERVRAIANGLSPKAIRILESIMLGELKNPDGTLVEGQNCTQRRLAAEKLLDLVGVSDIDLQDEAARSPEVTKIVINYPDTKENIAEARRKTDPYYDQRQNTGREN